MSDKETAKLRALIERPERCQFWGSNYVITPRLIAERFGDGKMLVCITPIMTRPDYFVARVDSSTKSVLDRCIDCRARSPFGRETLLDAIADAQEEEYGYYDNEDEDGNREDRGFPWVDWSDGCSWGRPFPVSEWKPAPPLVLWFQRDASFNRTGKASGRGPTRWHLPSKDDAALALCRSRGARRILIDDEHGEALPPKSSRCSMCQRAAWRVWRIP